MTGVSRSAGSLRVGLGLRGRLPALLVLLVLFGLIAAGFLVKAHGQAEDRTRAAAASAVAAKRYKPGQPRRTDADLYRSIVDEVHAGKPYYQAAAEQQRKGHYPLHPFVAMRSPVLAAGLAALPNELVRRTVLGALGAGVAAAWLWRLREQGAGWRLVPATGLIGCGVVAAFLVAAYPFHETWAGLLIALSLALRRPGLWWPSLLVGLLAALMRELATPYLLVMAVMAWRDGERREALAWLGAIAVVALSLVFHAHAVAAQVRPGDAVSQGWVKISGWYFVLKTMRWNTVLSGSPYWVAAVLGPLALLGAGMWRSPLGERLALTVFGYTVAFLFIGRPENAYWGLLIAPLLPLGLLMAPEALLALGRSLKGPRARRRP